MNIKTKYEIGQHIWIVYEHNGEVSVHDDVISEIVIYDKGLHYLNKEGFMELKEDEVILYEDLQKLAETVKETMKQIREKEAKGDGTND